jgi:hypothetical protein
MIIFAVDPGTEKSGYVLFDTSEKKVLESGIVENIQLLESSAWHSCDIVCIEMIKSYGMPVGDTTFTTILWIGRIVQIAYQKGMPYKLLYKKIDINPTLCFSNKAKDANIRQAILDLFEPNGGGATPQIGTKSQPGPLYGVSSHALSALAVALTYSIQNNLITR